MKTKKYYSLVAMSFVMFCLYFLFSNTASAQDLTGVKIHINPGHGGWDSDDRGIPTPLYPSVGPNVGFWESQSNLDKGLQLKAMLEELGATVQISRTQNRTEDDLPLSTIVQMANEFQSDFMLSIHSNAGAGTANYVLMLYAGKDANDTHVYPTATPVSDESRAISTLIGNNLIKNKMTNWTAANPNITGDKTFGRLYMGWSDGYGVLRKLTVPGVISEGSMHDYIPETYRLMNMEYKWLESWNFKKAFCTYFKDAEIPTGNIAGWVKDGRNLIMDGTYTKYGKDKLLPLNSAELTVLETNETYTVDNKRNGVYVFKDLQPGVYTVRAEAEGYYSQEQPITVVKNEIAYFNFELNKIRNTPPQVINYSPNVTLEESVVASTDIILEFNWDMDETSTRDAFSITPEVEGSLTFEDSQYRLRFRPSIPLEKSTIYTVKLDKSAKHPDNLTMEEDFIFQFKTMSRNRLSLIGGYPNSQNNVVYAPKPLFRYIFDEKLNTSNIRNEINVYDIDGNIIDKATRSVLINRVDAPYGDIYFELTDPLVEGNEYIVKITGDAMDNTGVKLVEPVEIHFTASAISVTDKIVVDDFEATDKYSFDAEQSDNITSASIARNTSQKLFGSSSYKIASVFGATDASAVYSVAEHAVSTETGKVFGLHVYGDMSGNELQLQFSLGTEVRYLRLCDLNFLGWRFVEAEFENEETYILTGIRIVRKEDILSKSTEIYVDNLLQYDADPTSVLSPSESAGNLYIYPNPVSDVIRIAKELNKEIQQMELYNLMGQLIRSVQQDFMPVSDISGGTYVIKIRLNNDVVAAPVIIRH